MIKSFRNKPAKQIFSGCHARSIPPDIQRIAARKLEMLAAATDLNALRIPPSNRLEKLKGSRAGQYSIRINDQWRICFKWTNGDAHDVEIVDYH